MSRTKKHSNYDDVKQSVNVYSLRNLKNDLHLLLVVVNLKRIDRKRHNFILKAQASDLYESISDHSNEDGYDFFKTQPSMFSSAPTYKLHYR